MLLHAGYAILWAGYAILWVLGLYRMLHMPHKTLTPYVIKLRNLFLEHCCVLAVYRWCQHDSALNTRIRTTAEGTLRRWGRGGEGRGGEKGAVCRMYSGGEGSSMQNVY